MNLSLTEYGLFKGVILRSYFSDSPSNRNEKVMEYDVQLVSGRNRGLVLLRCRSLNMFGGVVNYQEFTLQQRSKLLQGGQMAVDTNADQTDNSYVIVGFLEGDYNNAIILGFWPHPSNSAEGTDAADGIRLLGEFNGIRWNINSDGELIITYTGGQRDPKSKTTARPATSDTEIKIDKDGRFSIKDNTNQVIKLDRTTKTIKITSDDKETILLDTINKKIKIDCDSDEVITLDHNAHTIKIDCGTNALIEMDKATKKITASTSGDAKVIIDGTTNKIQIQGDKIEVGDALLEYIVKSTLLSAYISTKVTALFNAHTHNSGIGLTSIPTTQMVPPLESEIASLKHKVE